MLFFKCFGSISHGKVRKLRPNRSRLINGHCFPNGRIPLLPRLINVGSWMPASKKEGNFTLGGGIISRSHGQHDDAEAVLRGHEPVAGSGNRGQDRRNWDSSLCRLFYSSVSFVTYRSLLDTASTAPSTSSWARRLVASLDCWWTWTTRTGVASFEGWSRVGQESAEVRDFVHDATY